LGKFSDITLAVFLKAVASCGNSVFLATFRSVFIVFVMENGANCTQQSQTGLASLSLRRLISRKFGKPLIFVLIVLYDALLFLASTTNFSGGDSLRNVTEGDENSLLRVYSSSMASRMTLLTAKRTEMLQQLATHVPDLIVNRLMDSKMELPTMERNYGVLVFADVSGNLSSSL